MNRARILTLQAGAALLLPLMVSCVKKSEYDALQVENQALQTRVDQTSHELTQAQADAAALQQQVQKLAVVETDLREAQFTLKSSQQEVMALQGRLQNQPELQEARLALKKSQEESKFLKGQYDQFLAARRTAMVGRKYAVLSLDNGKTLQQAEITAISADEVSIRHSEGVAKVLLVKSPPELRWDVCYDLQENEDLKQELAPAKAPEKASRLAVAPAASPKPKAAAPVLAQNPPTSSQANAANALRAQLEQQRRALNAEYQALALKNAAAMRGVPWDNSQPESSPLLNSLSGSRAVLGISRLQSHRNAILSTLQQLRNLEPPPAR